MQKYHDEPKQYKGYLKSALAGMIWGFYLPEWGWVVAGSSILMVFMGNVCPDWTPVGLWVRRRRRAREALQLKAIALAQLTEKQGER